MLNADQRTELTQGMIAFSMRVLEGKECTVQETAILPSILSLLLKGNELAHHTNLISKEGGERS